MNKQTFESWLQELFIDLREVDGVPIIKDNCEDMFSGWLENRDVGEMMEYAEKWGQLQFMEGKEFVLKAFEPDIENLKEQIENLKKLTQ